VGIEGKSISTDGKSGVHFRIKFKCTATGCNSRGFFNAKQKNSTFLCARIEGTEYSASIYVYDLITYLSYQVVVAYTNVASNKGKSEVKNEKFY
jgi:hypothetical protein